MLIVDDAGLYLVHRGLRVVFTPRVFTRGVFIARAQLRVDGVVDLLALRERYLDSFGDRRRLDGQNEILVDLFAATEPKNFSLNGSIFRFK